MTSTAVQKFDSGHMDQVHDCQFDYYGRLLATASSDRSVRVFEVLSDQHQLLQTLTGHDGPVWRVAWGHPRFGTLLASCGFDQRVVVWRQGADGSWVQVYVSPPPLFTASINALAFAPADLGLVLAAGDSTGTITLLSHTGPDGQGGATWTSDVIPNAHAMGVFGVSWAPAIPSGALVDGLTPGPRVRRLASGGCDHKVKIWRQDPYHLSSHPTTTTTTTTWREEAVLEGHGDWVRDVAWCPSGGLPISQVASCAQDGSVLVWEEKAMGQWESQRLCLDGPGGPPGSSLTFGCPVWSVAWNTTGTVLSVSDENRRVTLWTQGPDGVWEMFSQQEA